MPPDVFQQVFSLSLAANRVNGFEGNQAFLQKTLQRVLASELLMIGTGWRLVWGPVVIKSEPENAKTGPQNSWYITFHPRLRFEDGTVHPTYVIAAAGTPKKALCVWRKENFAVDTVTDFKAWVAGGIQNRPAVVPRRDIRWNRAYIAWGTVKTVHVLLTTTAPRGAPSAGVTLLDFVTHVGTSASARIIFTGHSLGGALTPSLALALVLAGHLPAHRVLTYPIAGPSPGNAGFTELFVKKLPPRRWARGTASYQGWNLNLVNKLDVVPQAWCISKRVSPEQNLGNIPDMYGKPTLNLVRQAVRLAKAWSALSFVLYKPLPGQYFNGPCPGYAPNKVVQFLTMARWQHYEAYFREVGVPMRYPGVEFLEIPWDEKDVKLV